MSPKADFEAIATANGGIFTAAAAPFDARVDVGRASWKATAAALRDAGLELSDLTALDRGEGGLDLIAWLVASPTEQVRLGTELRDEDLVADSLTDVFPSAEWAEREVFDLFGVRFTGHPDMTRILLPDDATIHPLRKSFELQERTW
jgi:NADH-quinone oxidoreductase subunit C